jgi:arylsulfatase A-like enzyme
MISQATTRIRKANATNRQSRFAISVALWLVLSLLGAFASGCREEAGTGPAAAADKAPASAPARSTAPNLLLITLDTTRADALGTYGQPHPTSPSIDRLANGGVVFEQVLTSNPETLAAHSTLFTGKQPYVHGVRSNAGYVLSQRHVTLAEALRRAGYRTGAEVAAPVLRDETQVTQGFEHYRGAESPGVELKVVRFTKGKTLEKTQEMRVGADITARGIDFLRENRDEKFFLWLHYFDPHNPYSPPAIYNQRFPGDPYHGEVALADFQIGRVVDELDRLGVRGRTLIVVTADHGEGLGEHGEPSHSFFVYETVMRVPLIFSGLGLPASVRIPSLVRTADIAPTVLELMGLPPLDEIQGVSLAPLIRGETTDLDLTGYGEATRFTSMFGMPVLRTVRKGRWKYIHKVNPELFDVEADPRELNDLSSAHPDVLARMRAQLEALLAAAPAQPDDAQATLDAQTAAQLMALGYVAKSPAFSIGDEVASLELHGSDPVTRLEDIQNISWVSGLLRREEYAMALESVAGLRERNPDSTYVMGLEAEARAGLEQHDAAIELYARVVALEPQNRQAAYRLAGVLRAAGRGSEAVDLMHRLLAEEPCDERVRIDQNELLKELGRHAELVGVLEEGSRHCPEMLANLNNYAWALATLPEDDLRDGERAVEVIRQAIAQSTEPNPAYLDTLAAALAETGDFDGAIENGERVLLDARGAELPEEIMAELEGHLSSFRAGRPIRDPSPESS